MRCPQKTANWLVRCSSGKDFSDIFCGLRMATAKMAVEFEIL
jgi:hypothetical protein